MNADTESPLTFIVFSAYNARLSSIEMIPLRPAMGFCGNKTHTNTKKDVAHAAAVRPSCSIAAVPCMRLYAGKPNGFRINVRASDSVIVAGSFRAHTHTHTDAERTR